MVMIPKYQCIKCAVSGLFDRVEKFTDNPERRDAVVRAAFTAMGKMPKDTSPVEVSMIVNRIIMDELGLTEVFREEKDEANTVMLTFFEEHRSVITDGSYGTFRTLLEFSSAANIIDFGPRNHTIDFDGTLRKVRETGFHIDDSRELFRRLFDARSVVVLIDNAGEAVMDRLLIEFLRRHFPAITVTAVVRGGPVLNDVTMDDARAIGLDKAAHKVVSNGVAAPGTLLHRIDSDVKQTIETADIVISKGQGNLEGLIGEPVKNVFFVLMLKCRIIADLVPGGKKGDLVVMNGDTIREDT